ncbi:hypothetical protein ABZ154_09110 [Streptomyces sp. NPDC006261]|uniref:hypothetical protein n=1 Tax=Streptomyces sp. NPDC006261 TaxID=3156739 RepID=UPI0033AB4DE8
MLKVGDKIRILEQDHNDADVDSGEILRVSAIAGEDGCFGALQEHEADDEFPWEFHLLEEGTGWEKWEETK